MEYLSLFSGIGAGEQAIKELGLDWSCVGYSEIDPYAIKIYEKHFPNHKNFGDITKIDIKKLPDFDLIIFGAPCTDLSIAKQNRKGLAGERSGLFYKAVEIIKEKKPRYVLCENVNSMAKDQKNIITKELSEAMGEQIDPIMICASLVSAQQRKRLFWCNWKVEQPKDRGIYLKDILEDGEPFKDKAYCLTANGKDFVNDFVKRKQGNYVLTKPIRVGHLNKGGQGDRIYSIGGKSVCLSANGGGRGAKTGLYLITGGASRTYPRIKIGGVKREKRIEIRKDGKANSLTTVQTDSMAVLKDYVRKLTPIECERLQNFPDRFTETGIENGKEVEMSNTRRYKALGNSFNVEVIKHILTKLNNIK